MKFTTSITAAAAIFSVASAATLEKKSCVRGSYAVKIEAHTEGCTDPVPAASIANYGGAGPCADTLNGHNYLKGINGDGCPSSRIDLHCYSSQEQCDADTSGAGGAFSSLDPNACVIAPPNCPYYRAVAG